MILYMEKRGCPFHGTDGWCKGHREDASDIGNYRICTTENVNGKDGNSYFLEFHFGNGIRYTNKRNGQNLKHPVKDAEYADFLWMDTCYETCDGSYRNIALEKEVFDEQFTYTVGGVLKAVNYVCGENKYDAIAFID